MGLMVGVMPGLRGMDRMHMGYGLILMGVFVIIIGLITVSVPVPAGKEPDSQRTVDYFQSR